MWIYPRVKAKIEWRVKPLWRHLNFRVSCAHVEAIWTATSGQMTLP